MTVWDTLVGQPRAVSQLQAAALTARGIVTGDSDGTLAQAWLFAGPPGSGRSVAARALAAALQCTGPVPGCGECQGCRTTLAGSNLDVTVVATEAPTIPIRYVREELLPLSASQPALGRWRVVIVEDADRMTERTSNVLLKELEEPAPRTVWVLCVPTPDDLLVTIRSRCRLVQLVTPSAADVAGLLVREERADPEQALLAAQIAQSHVGVARALVANPELRAERLSLFTPLLQAAAAGSVGSAVHAAGQLLAAAKDSGAAEHASRSAAEKAALLDSLGAVGGKRLPPSLRGEVRRLEEEQKRRGKRALADALDRALLDLLGFFRDVLMRQTGADASDINPDLAQMADQWATHTSADDTLARTAAIDLARKRLHTNAAPLLLIEALAVSLVDPALAGE